MKNYRESSDKQTLDIQNTIKEIIKAQEEQQIHTKSIEDKHDNSDRKMDSKIKENQD